ncbi:T-box transcription factor TBX15 [Salmo salar]|uniref:T-box transcription factor TBX15 n=1 Tax=Salmo salar TaxID=8030 RepID=B5X6K6_SALSA|nr:T-box transcription factor TBX15 [Salmo salar]ACI66476.1 T-box transcription factor TBX15 [Salmo salar]|eukprot:NP_001134176.1 T-box transcription factor TBX15 [Salmo salar]
MSDRRRSAAALSSRAHAFSVEALIGSNKKRKLRGWEEKDLELSMESLANNGQLGDGDDPVHCLDIDPGQCITTITSYFGFFEYCYASKTKLRIGLSRGKEEYRKGYYFITISKITSYNVFLR